MVFIENYNLLIHITLYHFIITYFNVEGVEIQSSFCVKITKAFKKIKTVFNLFLCCDILISYIYFGGILICTVEPT